MRFAVKRTISSYDDDAGPCPGAVKGTLPYWDCRTFKSPEEHDAKLKRRDGEGWFDRGTEHQITYGPRGGVHGIKRRTEDVTAWFIEIDSIEALMAFYEEHGDLVLTESFGNNGQPCIEIYDGYRE